MAGQTYRDLEVWQKSMDLVVQIYEVSKLFPKDEQFGLTNQIRRAAVSIPANIAEGQGRLHEGDFVRFLSIAGGSLTETETHLLIAIRLTCVRKEQVRKAWELAQQVGHMLNGLIRSKRSYIEGNGKISETAAPSRSDHDPDQEYPLSGSDL